MTTETVSSCQQRPDPTQLAEESAMPELREAVHRLGGQSTYAAATGRLQSLAIAIAYAEALLRMVAAAMDDEPANTSADAAEPAAVAE